MLRNKFGAKIAIGLFLLVPIMLITGIRCKALMASQKTSLTLRLELPKHSVMLYEPIEVKVLLRNNGENVVEIPGLDPRCTDHLQVQVKNLSTGEVRTVGKLVLILEHRESPPLDYTIRLKRGEEKKTEFLLTFDWGLYEPVFSILGEYEVWATLRLSQERKVVSNVIRIEVKQIPKNSEIAQILSDKDILICLYEPKYIHLCKNKRAIIEDGVAKLVLIKDKNPFEKYAQGALNKWREEKKDLRNPE